MNKVTYSLEWVLILLSLFSLSIGCTRLPDYSVEPTRVQTVDKIEEWAEKWLFQMLRAMDEPDFREEGKIGSEHLRLLHVPTFHKPTAIRISRTGSGAIIRIARLSGMGGYSPGTLEYVEERELSLDEWRDAAECMHSASSWSASRDRVIGNDGSFWLLEVVGKREHRIVLHWAPLSNTKARDLEKFMRCCDILWRMSNLPLDDGSYY